MLQVLDELILDWCRRFVHAIQQVEDWQARMTVTAGSDRPLGLCKPRRSRVAHFLCQPPNYGRPDLPSPRPHASLKHSPGSSLFPIAELSSTSLPQVRLARSCAHLPSCTSLSLIDQASHNLITGNPLSSEPR